MPAVPDAASCAFLYHRTQSFTVPKGQTRYQPLHRHPNTVELLLLVEGELECVLDQETNPIFAGTVLLIHPGVFHEISYPASHQQSGYCLSFVRHSSAVPAPEAKLAPIISVKELTGLEALFVQLQWESISPHADSSQVAHHLIGLLLAQLGRFRNQSHPVLLPSPRMIQEIKHFMEENHCRSLSLEDLAAEFKLNKYELARLFKQQTGISPLQYVIACRMDTAKHLLTTTTRPVSAVSSATGYKSVTQFQAAFKKAVGTTPRHYRLEFQTRT